jgi:hypothetical protein
MSLDGYPIMEPIQYIKMCHFVDTNKQSRGHGPNNFSQAKLLNQYCEEKNKERNLLS